MKTFLLFLPKIAVVLFVVAGIILVPLGLPGIWVIVATAFLYSLFFDLSVGHWDGWIVLLLIFFAVIGEVLEFLVGTLGSKKLNVSTGAIIASVAGGLIGVIVGVPVFLVGSLLGLLLGAFLGALLYEWFVTKDFQLAIGSAIAVFFSRMVASFIKTCIALGMGVYLLIKVF